MSYFTISCRSLTINKASLRVLLSTVAVSTVFSVAAMAASSHGPVLQHDDHGQRPPIPKGTGSELCQSGVSSGFPCKNVELLARLPLTEIGGGQGADSWGWKDTETGRYYALFARSTGTSFVDVTDPRSPVYLGNLPSTTGSTPLSH